MNDVWIVLAEVIKELAEVPRNGVEPWIDDRTRQFNDRSRKAFHE